MKNQFEIAGGTIAGRTHIMAEKNNQDAYHWRATDDAIVCVVCDGCGSSKHSEVGARIGSCGIVEKAMFHFVYDYRYANREKMLYDDIVSQLMHTVYFMGGVTTVNIVDHFLFTVVGLVVTPLFTTIFHLGDGMAIINNAVFKFGPYPNNEPPYLGYALLGKESEHLRFRVDATIPTEELQSAMVGTDGVNDLMRVADQRIPGTDELVGPIEQFWQGNFFKNPDMIRRRLSRINRTVLRADWINKSMEKENGLLPDDTTFVVVRRKA